MTLLLKRNSLILLLLLFSFGVHADSAPFKFSRISTEVTGDVLSTINTQHYKKIRIDDTFGKILLDVYLDALDPNHLIFITSDISEFRKTETQLDDQLQKGQLNQISTIYNRYIQRSQALLNWTLSDPGRYMAPYPDALAVIEIDRKDALWPVSAEKSRTLWDQRVFNEVLELKLSNVDKETIPDLIKRRYSDRLHRMEKMTEDDVFEIFINALTSLYDPHTNWLSPRAQENFRISMSLSLEGIGAVLQMDEEKTKIMSLVTGGPAAKTGEILPGDYILAVAQDKSDWVAVIGWRLDEVVQLIRGPKGSIVRLQIQSGQDKSIKTVTIQRDQVKLEDQAAKKAIIKITGSDKKEYKIGIINVPSFYSDFEALREGDESYRSTTKDVVILLAELEKEKVDGIVLDLRNNGGGSLREAATFTDLFIDPGPVVQIRTADNQISRSLRSQYPAIYNGPLLVLINHLSASATEIFAGAIQDYHRGFIVGEQSFGKGTVQAIADLHRGQLKLTTSKFYRVSGDSTQHRGVIPDISIPSLFDFKTIGESALDNSLPWDSIHPAPHMEYTDVTPYINNLKKYYSERMKKNADYQFLMDRINFLSKRNNIKTLSLDEKIRQEDRTKNEAELLSISNKLRIEKGLKKFDVYDDLEKDETARIAEQSVSNKIDIENDFVIRESAAILSDYIKTKANNVALH